MRVQLRIRHRHCIETEGFTRICVRAERPDAVPSRDDCMRSAPPAKTTGSSGAMAHTGRARWYRDTISLRRADIDPFEHVNNTIYWHGIAQPSARPPCDGTYRAVLGVPQPHPGQRTADHSLRAARRRHAHINATTCARALLLTITV